MRTRPPSRTAQRVVLAVPPGPVATNVQLAAGVSAQPVAVPPGPPETGATPTGEVIATEVLSDVLHASENGH
jgi:hypothetical protein